MKKELRRPQATHVEIRHVAGVSDAMQAVSAASDACKVSPPALMTEAAEWLPESLLRDALIAERLPAALASRTLFWINIREYLSHHDAQLPPEDYLGHWRDIYRCCLSEDTSRLRSLSYVTFENPGPDDVN